MTVIVKGDTSTMSSLRAGMFQLFCFILGEPESTFHVDIADTETVSHLRDDILKKNRNALGKVDSSQLKLYKVCELCQLSFSIKPPTSITYGHSILGLK